MGRIGVVTSGGDAPGMNAAVRAITRIACSKNIEVLGFERGWEGLIGGLCVPLTPRSVGGIIQLGGTMLLTSRSLEFKKKEGLQRAAETLKEKRIDGLIVIGGNGSFKGAQELSNETDTAIIGVPATIDNDVYGSDETIGFDTAVNTALKEIDKIRDTAISHERVFVVEVMGRKRGFLALTVGLTVGAEVILVPEVKLDEGRIAERLRKSSAKGKKSAIIVAAEGFGDTKKLTVNIEKRTGSEVRLSIVGYAQRGGSPSARSRLLASLFAEHAVRLFEKQKANKIVCLQHGEVGNLDIAESCRKEKQLDVGLLNLAETLAT